MPSRSRSDPLLLALDSAGPVGSVAVGRAGRVLASELLGERSRHAEDLLPAVARALSGAGADRRDLGGVVLGAGPGSFTGVRVAAATAKGICHALGVSLWPISSLRAVASETYAPAQSGPSGPPDVCTVLFDARGDRVYAAAYRPGQGHALIQVRPPEATTVHEVVRGWAELRDGVVTGDGAGVHRALLTDASWTVAEASAGANAAVGLLRLHWSGPVRPAAQPASWEPDYLKGSSARLP